MSARPNRGPAPALRVRAMMHEDLEQVVETEREIYPHPWTRGNFVDSLQSGYDAWMFEDGPRMTGYAIAMWAADEVHLLNISVAARSRRAASSHSQRSIARPHPRPCTRAATDRFSRCTSSGAHIAIAYPTMRGRSSKIQAS